MNCEKCTWNSDSEACRVCAQNTRSNVDTVLRVMSASTLYRLTHDVCNLRCDGVDVNAMITTYAHKYGVTVDELRNAIDETTCKLQHVIRSSPKRVVNYDLLS